MPTFKEQIQTSLDIEAAFAFVADFANSSLWDPGVASSSGSTSPGRGRRPISPRHPERGRVVPMEYRITFFEPPPRVVLAGEGSGVRATTTSASRPPTPGRGSTTLPTSGSGACSAWPNRSPAGRSPASPATRATGCSGSSTSGPARPTGTSREHRHRRVRHQRPDRRIRPAPITGSRSSSRIRSPEVTRGPSSSTPRTDGSSRHGLHRLQRADIPPVRRPPRRARGRDAAQ